MVAKTSSEGMRMCSPGIWTKAEKPGMVEIGTIPETQKVMLTEDYNP